MLFLLKTNIAAGRQAPVCASNLPISPIDD